MTKKELLEIIADIHSNLHMVSQDLKTARNAVDNALAQLEEIPDEENEIVDKEDEDAK